MRAGRWLPVGLAAAAAGTVALVTAGGGAERVEAGSEVPPLATIAKRVEDIRGLRFERLPKVRRVTRRQLQAEFDRQLDRLSGAELRRYEGDQEAYKLLGFVDPEADAEEGADTSDILGVYDFRTKQLTIVTDAQGDPFQAELTIAHELAHALEDQAFKLGDPGAHGDDAAAAYRAAAEGSATLVEAQYARRHLGGGVTTKRLAYSQPASTKKAKPSYSENASRFTYLDGSRFVAQLHRRGGWKLVNRALQLDQPVSTEEILHPDAYLDGEGRDPVRLRAERVLGPRFHRLAGGAFGEFDTSQMLLAGALTDDETTRSEAAKGAAGWAAGRYELWRAGRGERGCSEPCVERDVLVVAWQWDRAADAAQFARLLRPYLEEFQKLRPAGRGSWRGKVVAAALAVRGHRVTLVFAPAPALARLVAQRAQ